MYHDGTEFRGLPLVQAALSRNAAARKVGTPSPSADDEEVPDDFLDPLVHTVMQDPVKLPDSRIVVDRFTIQRHLMTSANDPFTRSPLSLDDVQPDDALRARIEAWSLARSSSPAAAQPCESAERLGFAVESRPQFS